MSNLLLDYAVNIDRKTPVALGSFAYLKRLGILIEASAGVTEDVVFATSAGVTNTYSDGSPLALRGLASVADFATMDISTLKTGYVYVMSDAGDIDKDASGNGSATLTVAIGDKVVWSGSEFELWTSGLYVDGDAYNYINPTETIKELISRLGGVYLVFSRDPAVIKANGENKFFTITHDALVPDSEVISSLALWQGVAFVGDKVGQTLVTGDANSIVRFNIDDEAVRLSAVISMLSDLGWHNQQYSQFIVTATAQSPEAMSVTSVGQSNILFNDSISFYLWDEENKFAYLGFLGTTSGLSITSPYVRKEIEIKTQNAFVQLVSLNEPYNIMTTRKVLQSQFSKLIKSYIDAGLLDSEGANSVTVERDAMRFYVRGVLRVTNASALWRANITAYYGETPTSADGTTLL